MKTLIIGGTRYLGAAIARELHAHAYEVSVLHRGKTPGDLPGEVTHLLGDARDPGLVGRHLRERRYDAVVDTILQAADLAWCLPLLRRYAGQLAHCGSTGVYAPAARVPSRETDPTPCPEVLGGFGAKLAQDQALLDFHEKTGFHVCSLRVSNVIGAGDVPLDIWGARNPAYFQRLADHEAIWIPNDGRALVQPVHVNDLARGFRAAIETEKAAGQVYNLSCDRPVTLTGYAEYAREILGSRSSFRYVAMEEILATGKANESGLRFLCEHMCIDSGKARRDLGYRPVMDVRESLRESLAWMVEKGLLRAEVKPEAKGDRMT
jgi:nucleoside-diphosphate-sugar epimerase